MLRSSIRAKTLLILRMCSFLKCRWLISQNIAHFSTCKKPPKFLRNLNKTADVKMRGNNSMSCIQRGVGGGHAFQSSVSVAQNFQAHEPLDRILG